LGADASLEPVFKRMVIVMKEIWYSAVLPDGPRGRTVFEEVLSRLITLATKDTIRKDWDAPLIEG